MLRKLAGVLKIGRPHGEWPLRGWEMLWGSHPKELLRSNRWALLRNPFGILIERQREKMKTTNLFLEMTTWTNGSGGVTTAVVTFKWPAWVLAGAIIFFVLVCLWIVSRRKVQAEARNEHPTA